jgi:hypothetical protein
VSRLTQGHICFLPIRGYHPLWRGFPSASRSYRHATGLVRVRSPLLTESRLISFPAGTEMFHFPAFAFYTYVFSVKYLIKRWVSPFGHFRVNGCWHLTGTFRSLPRPSSPLIAKAFTRCPSKTLEFTTRRGKAAPATRGSQLYLSDIGEQHCTSQKPQHAMMSFQTYSRYKRTRGLTPRISTQRALTRRVVDPAGIEPATSCLQSRRSPG